MQQPAPKKNNNPHINDMVVEILNQRKEMGIRKYGVALQANNGRNALQDAFEEALDLSLYLKQKIEEEKDRMNVNEQLHNCVKALLKIREEKFEGERTYAAAIAEDTLKELYEN